MSARYVVVEAFHIGDLVKSVEALVKEGYAPMGGVAVLRSEPDREDYQQSFYQAMFRPANYFTLRSPT